MDNEEIFNINTLLKTLYLNFKSTLDQKNITLFYQQTKGLPREFRGDHQTLTKLLNKLLNDILQKSNNSQILLSVLSVDEFLYEEIVTFGFFYTNLNKDELFSLYDEEMIKLIKILDGELININEADIAFQIPLRNKTLGSLRHYRLTDDSLLNKKVWLLCTTPLSTKLYKTFFTYFNYTVDEGNEDFKNIEQYDIVIVEDDLLDKAKKELLQKAYQKRKFYIIIITKEKQEDLFSFFTILQKPLLQECVWNSIESMKIFQNTNNDLDKFSNQIKQEIPVDKLIFHIQMDEREQDAENLSILSKLRGERNHDNNPLMYQQSLKIFVAKYKHSSVEFKQMVNEKSLLELKQFCEKLYDSASRIGSLNMAHLMETLLLIIENEEYHMLDMNILKYRISLSQLLQEIDKTLKKQ